MMSDKIKRINVLHVVPNLNIGGIQDLVLNILKYNDYNEFNLYLICVVEKGDLYSEAILTRAKVLYLGHHSKNPLSIYKIYKFIKENKIKIVHTHGSSNTYGRMAAIFAGVGKIYAGHYADIPEKWYKRLADRILIKKTNKVIACASSIKEFLIDNVKLSDNKIKVIPNAIDMGMVDSSFDVDILKKKQELSIPLTHKVIGCVARLDPIKGYKYLIESIPQLLELEKNLKVLIVGDGELQSDLKSLVDKLGITSSVLFMGSRRDFVEIIQIMDIYVVSSIHEGVPLSMLYALATGRPTISTNVAGIPEVITHEKTGVLIEPKSPKRIAEEVLKLLRDREKMEELGENARKYALENFSSHKLIKRVEELYMN